MLAMCVLGLSSVAAFAVLGPRLAGLLPPRTATVVLVGGALLTTAAVLAVVDLLAATVLARLPVLTRAGDWSPQALRSGTPVPTWLASCCVALLVPAGVLGTAALVSRTRAILRMRRVYRGLDTTAPVLVLDSEWPEAFATPAGGGRVVVTTGMLRGLQPDEIAVLLAHEASHLRHRHAWWVLLAQICGAVNPVLRPVVPAVAHAVERWADEDAAAELGDRRLVARAVARAALHVRDASGGVAPGAPAVRAVGGDVLARVRSLQAGPPRRQVTATLTLVLLTAVSLAWAAGVQDRTDDFFDAAHTHPPPTACRVLG